MFCERPLSPTRCANRSIGTTDSGALEGMPETEGEAQLSIQRSAIDKNGRVLMHKIVNRKGKQSGSFKSKPKCTSNNE